MLDASFFPRLVKVVQDFAPGSPRPSLVRILLQLALLGESGMHQGHENKSLARAYVYLSSLLITFQHSKVLEIRKKRQPIDPIDMGLHAD